MQKLNKELLEEKISKTLKLDLENANIAGASVIVAQNGEVLINEQVRYSDISTKTPLKQNSIFRLASMTKPITAIAFLIGVEKGWFSPDNKVSMHFPQFEKDVTSCFEDVLY